MVPTIETIDGIDIRIRARDHGRPHFHIIGPDFEMSVAIDTFEILAGTHSDKARKAMAWAKRNQAALESIWRKYHG